MELLSNHLGYIIITFLSGVLMGWATFTMVKNLLGKILKSSKARLNKKFY